MEGFTPDNPFEPANFTPRDGEPRTLIIQPAFVEGIVPEERSFEAVSDAFRFIFRNNKEYGILLWNGLPVRFSYTKDLPQMIEPLTALCAELLHARSQGAHLCNFSTPSFDISWEVNWLEDGVIAVRQRCRRIAGDYRGSLEELGTIALTATAFLREWKLVIAQLCEAYRRSGVTVSEEAKATIDRLEELNERIVGYGSLHDYPTV